MSSNIAEIAIEAPLTSNPLDVIPDEIPFDVPYGRPISLEQAQAVIQAAVAEAKKRNWKMNVAVADSGGRVAHSSLLLGLSGAVPRKRGDAWPTNDGNWRR
jgi:glc operon protein GlcG